MKFKNLTKEQIIISLDRLTRFKPTKEKYLRVFFDIILSNLQEPQIKKTQLLEYSADFIRDTAVEILNNSIHTILNINDENRNVDYNINIKLAKYENSTFVNDSYTQDLLNNKIDFKNAIKLISDTGAVNLKWLKTLENIEYEHLIENRERHSLKYPIDKVLLVEGLTEETLLPAFSNFLGYDFYQKGIQIIPAGGKNQVVRIYYELSELLKVPIFLLLDKDAEDNLNQIRPKLRSIDRIHLVSCGEFEDLLPESLIIKAVNNHLSNLGSITQDDIDNEKSHVENLELIFKEKGLHEFKKAEFAKLVKVNITSLSDVSKEIKDIINEIFC